MASRIVCEASKTPDKLEDRLMGHDAKKPKYGDGHGLGLKRKYIQLVALAPGMRVLAALQLAATG